MFQVLHTLLIIVLVLDFVVLGVSRIRAVISAVALQGMVLGVFPLFIHPEIGIRGVGLVVVIIGLKGIAIPYMLRRAMREVHIQHEVNPLINYMSSLLLGAVGTALAIVFAFTLPLAGEHADSLLVPSALATVWTGFLMLMTRQKAIMQVLGYLLLENGIFLFGLLLLEAMPLLVEIGILLDLFTGVFVMGIIVHHISRELASTSTEYLQALHEPLSDVKES
jgi:hydrogenase-4 component E